MNQHVRRCSEQSAARLRDADHERNWQVASCHPSALWFPCVRKQRVVRDEEQRVRFASDECGVRGCCAEIAFLSVFVEANEAPAIATYGDVDEVRGPAGSHRIRMRGVSG